MVYETSPEKVLLFEMPIWSLTIEIPYPSRVFEMGLLKEKECVMGAPSNPTHWLRCKRNILVTPLEPAYAGFMAIVLYMYWVYCESCCAKMLLTEVSSIIQNK